MRRFLPASILSIVLLIPGVSVALAATRRAILIGINQYNPPDLHACDNSSKPAASRRALVSGDVRHWRYTDLDGAINDVNLMEGLLLSPDFGFQPPDIVKLITPDVTTAESILT